ncbi:hypothetical protein SAMN04487939_1238 [Lysobacter sp. yr284]|uniref:hypothetical protein n=1 Tax=Lysobacter sp. yr284 TaxID=1761791 RepID=UPI00089A4597|nr:hypothetical protein [Lysobacter sp. yr284]SDZ21120.1 hypothetical protein SAMN04487939_1238 [Lysobacter sp. yr284]
MDENLHYLLHQELDGLFDPPPAAGAGPGDGALSPPASQAEPPAAFAARPERDDDDSDVADADAEPASEPTRAERLRDPKLLQALVRLLGLRG